MFRTSRTPGFLLPTFVAVLACTTTAAGAESWPFIRGPRFDGHAADAKLADRWPEKGPPVVWTRRLGEGYSAFVGDERRVYTQYQTLLGQYLVCLDARTGETLWEHRYGWPHDAGGLYPGPRSTPTLADGRIYFTSPEGVLAAHAANTGERLWRVDLFETFEAELPGFGYACSPTVVDGVVLVPVGGKGSSMVALDARDGTLVWRSGSDPVSYTPAYPIEQDGRKLVVGYFENTLNVFDRVTGEELVRLELSQGYDEHAAWPIHQPPHLWISGPFRAGSRLLELSLDPPALSTVWNRKGMSNDVCSSVLVEGHVYGFDLRDIQSKAHRPTNGWFRCIELATGDVKWSNGLDTERRELDDESSTSLGHASVLHADGKLLLFNDTGDLILLRANPERCEELARVRVLGGRIGWTTPALVGSRVYLRSGDRAVCLDLGPEDDADADRRRVADLPQSSSRDWAATVLPREPEYMMDAPTGAALGRWYVASLLIGWVAAPLAALAVVGALRLVPSSRVQPGYGTTRALHLLLAFVGGAAGTTLLGHWQGEFVFTWPVTLAVAFEVVVARANRAGQKSPDHRTLAAALRDRLPVLAFLALCVAYYALCRRLGLAFEWCFLMGFPAALPLLWWSTRLRETGSPGWRLEAAAWLCSALAFTAFYWAGAGVLAWRY